MILLFIAMIIYYFLVYLAIKESNSFKFIKSISNKEVFINMLLIFFVVSIAYALKLRENYIYFWDYSTYWRRTLEVMNVCSGPFNEAIKKIIDSINFSDYNLLQGMLMAIPLKILGSKYLSYILVIFIEFLIPVSIIITLIIQNLFDKYLNKRIKSYYILGGCLFFVWFWQPALNGFADMAAVLMVSSCILVTFSMDFCDYTPRKDVFIAILLLTSMILRRTFAYWVLGYSVGIFFMAILQLRRCDRDKKITSALNIIKNFLLTYVLMVGILIIFFRPFFIRSLFNNYKIAYQAYNTTDLLNKILELVRYLGIYIVPIICIIFYSIIKKRITDEIIFFIISILTSVFTFYRTQNMGIHHYYIISVQILIMILLGIWFWIIESWKISKIFVLVGLIGYIMNFCHGISLLPDILQRSIVWSDNVYKMKQRDDMPEIQLLKKYLEDITPGYEGIYVIGSSDIMTSDILTCSYLPNLNPEINIFAVPQVDLRDGFSTSFFDAKVIVCATPAQYHLSPDTQRVVGILTEEFENSDSIIRNKYKLGSSFSLDKGVRLNVYIKKADFTKAEIDYLADKFEDYYSNYPEFFRDRFQNYIRSMEK